MEVSLSAVLGIATGCSALAGTVCGGLLYVVRAEQGKAIALVDSRIGRHEAECEQRNKHADERHTNLTKDLNEIKTDVKSILRHTAGQ